MLEENVVDATQENVVDSQPTEEVTEVVETEVTETEQSSDVEPSESVSEEVAPSAEKEEQSPEENAKFADVRRKAEREAEDRLISNMYGDSHGIHTKAEYDKAVAEQKQRELMESLKDGEVDPNEIYKQMKENDPEYQAMKQSKQEAYVKNQLSELNNDLKGMELDITVNSIEDLVKLPNSEEVTKYVEKGMTLSEAYFLANKQDIINKNAAKIQQDTINKITANGESSPGALSDTGETPSFFTEAQVDAMSQADVNKNLDLIMKSMKSW